MSLDILPLKLLTHKTSEHETPYFSLARGMGNIGRTMVVEEQEKAVPSKENNEGKGSRDEERKIKKKGRSHSIIKPMHVLL